MSRTLVTGAAGFIGSHLSEFLLERGHSVIGMDSLITGDVANIEHLTGRDFIFVKHDVTHYIAVEQGFGEMRPDEAGRAGDDDAWFHGPGYLRSGDRSWRVGA